MIKFFLNSLLSLSCNFDFKTFISTLSGLICSDFKGFTDNQNSVETPNDVVVTEKPLKSQQIRPERVDINVLKSKLQETESKEFKKNLILLSTLILGLGILGIYLSF